jgi:methylase of polypeptide subunit release factors
MPPKRLRGRRQVEIADVRTRELRAELRHLPPLVAAERVARPDSVLARRIDEARIDRARLIVDLYEERGSTADRKSGGVFYTPPSIIEAMLDRLPATGEWLDPAAGAGAFLIALARRFGNTILRRLRAYDIDSGALDVAALALEAALGKEARAGIALWRRTRAHTIDFLRTPHPSDRPDVIIGNPPYGLGGGEDLASLFSALGGEIDLYACFLARSLQAVRPGGTVALLVPDTWLTNTRSIGLRSLLSEHGLCRIVDFGKPFADAKDTRVHAVFASAGSAKCEVEATRQDRIVPMSSVSRRGLSESTSRGWFLYRTTGERKACRVIESAPRLGASYDVIYGLRTGDNARHVMSGDGTPRLVAGRDLEAYDRRVAPRYLRDPGSFSTNLARQSGRWKLGVQRIRTNSTTSWRRWVEAAPVRPEEIGLDSLTLIADRTTGEKGEPSNALLHLLGVLNSSFLNRWYRLTFTDVNVKPVYLAGIPVPPVDSHIAELVRRRLQRPGDGELERSIDRLVAHAYGLSESEIACLEEEFWGGDGPALPSIEDARALAA